MYPYNNECDRASHCPQFGECLEDFQGPARVQVEVAVDRLGEKSRNAHYNVSVLYGRLIGTRRVHSACLYRMFGIFSRLTENV